MVVVYAVANADPFSFYGVNDNESNLSVQCSSSSSSSQNASFLSYNAKNGGIPTVLGVNIALWAGMIIGFCILRRLAWNYARVGLIQKQHWASSVYSQLERDSPEQTDDSKPNVVQEEGYISWIWTTITLSHDSMTRVCGQDAGHYLSFIRHLIVLQIIITVLSTGVILPANYSGTLESEGYARTTVSNLDKNSNVYWLHNVFSVVYMVLVIVMMTLFARQLRKKRQQESFHTLMITQVPVNVTKEEITTHFEEAYSNVVDVQFAFDVSKLTKLHGKRVTALRNLARYKEMSEAKGSSVTMHIGPCNCCGPEVDGESHFRTQVEHLTDQQDSVREAARHSRLEIAFVTLADSAMAERAKLDYRLGRKPASSSVAAGVKSDQWSVELAPMPENLKWANLSTGVFLWWARFVLVNAVLCTFLFFWTTPVVIISSLGSFNISVVSEATAQSGFITIWLPTLLLWLVTALLPLVVSYSTYLENHWTKSDFELYIMRKTFIFLMLMALVLPALGLASLDSFFTHFNTRTAVINQLQCIFLPNNGGFFISYVTFCAFIGTAVELLRLPALLGYVVALKRAKTKHEKEQAKKAIAGQFQFGVEYAWVITIFGICLVFSITCPLIASFGLAYLLLKYFIDKYNLYFALGRSHRVVKNNVHHTAVNFVILCAVLLQLIDLFFSLVRLRRFDPHTIFALVMFIASLTYVIASMVFGQLSYLTPFRETYEPRNDADSCLPPGSYEAPVLRDNVDSVDSMGEILLSGEMEDDDDVLVGISRDSSDQRPRSVQSGYRTF